MLKNAFCSWSARGGNRCINQTLLVMRLTAFLLTVTFLNVSATGVSQNVTFTGENVTLEKVFSAVKRQTGFLFLYPRTILREAKPVSVSAHNLPLEDFLADVFKSQPLEYNIKGKNIFISPRSTVVGPSDPLPQLSGTTNLSDTLIVRGTVVDENGEPLAGVNVVVKGTGKGTAANVNGVFGLKNVEENAVIVISSVGYVSQEVKITGFNLSLKSMFITMKRSTKSLDETQVIAYGKTTKRFSTGNITTIKAEDIDRQPVMTALDVIAGRVPGVTIRQTSGNSAAPVVVEIRGKNTINPNAITDPLYVIDGIPMTTLNASALTGNSPMSMGAVQGGYTNTLGENPLLSINPRDIESIDVLKDGDATAIYGSRAANGVILITTKRAKSGPTRFDLSVNNGIKTIQKYPELLNTRDYLAIRREAFKNDGISPDVYNAPDLMLWDSTRYTDWQRLLVGTGNMLIVNAGISGGLLQNNYSVSASYASTEELMNNGGKNQRASLRTFFSHTSLNQKFNITIGNNLAVTDVRAYAIGDLGNIPPNAPDIYNDKNEFNFAPYRGQFASQFKFGGLIKPSDSKTFSLQSTISIRYEILKGLTVSATGGYNLFSNNNINVSPAAAMDAYFFAFSSAYYGNSTLKSFTVEPQIAYNTFIGKGRFSAQLIGSMQKEVSNSNTMLGFMYPNDDLMKSINNAQSKSIMEGFKEYRYLSVAAILRYEWDRKYIINLNARRDGSSRFGPGRQFGDFGSVGVAWIASEEKWIKDNVPAWISFIKFRGSYGITGSDGIGDYEYLSRWSNGYSIDNPELLRTYNGVNAFHVVRALNQNFQWESTHKKEVAASVGFFEDKINIEFSYYSNLSKQQLTIIATPDYSGFSSVTGNWDAQIRNSGIEITLTGKLIDTKDWGLSLNFNIGRNQNKLVGFPGLEKSPYAGTYKIGQSLRATYLFHYTGIDPLTGAITFEDHNKDGKIYSTGTSVPTSEIDDRYLVKDINQKYIGGFGINTTYKRVALYTQFSFVNRLSAEPYLDLIVGSMNNLVLPKEIMDNHWKQPGDLAKYPRFTTSQEYVGTLAGSDAYYVNGSYIRLSSLALSYQFPLKWIGKVKMKDARIGLETQNLFTLTSFKGMDPDIPSFRAATPTPRTTTVRLMFNF